MLRPVSLLGAPLCGLLSFLIATPLLAQEAEAQPGTDPPADDTTQDTAESVESPAEEPTADISLDTTESPPAKTVPDAEPISAAPRSEPPAPTSSASEAGTGERISDEEVDRFLEEASLGDHAFQPRLDLSGFADFNYTHFVGPDDDPWRILYNNKGHFGVGNLNLYLDGRISETVRSFAEVRFTYLPHGQVDQLGPPTTRTSNVSSDYTRNERDIRLGGLRIERAFLQWSPHQLFRITAGHWLTPYGLWNVDHGTPTIVPVTRPFVIDEELLPESQSGILIEGRYDVTDHLALEYGAGISNGRGPIDMYYDFDNNKGLTGRLKLLYAGTGDLQIGVSGYHGTYTNADINLNIDEDGLSSSDIITTQFKEASVAADVRYTYGGFLFQSEAMLNDRVYEEGGRSSTTGGLTPDSRRWGVYGLTGYRFDWFGVMPYVIGEYSPVPNASIPELPRKVLLLGGGVNVRAIAQVVVKLGYDQAVFPDARENSFEEHAIRRLQGQVAWAF